MKIATDIMRRFSIKLMLIAMLALTLHAGFAYVAGPEGAGDCLNGVHVIHVDHDTKAVSIEHGDADHARHTAPRKSTCCSVACSMVMLAAQTTLPALAFVPAAHDIAVVRGAEGIDLKGLSRPPKGRLTV